ncbi:MAG: ADOP family duplicated permease [Gemmatimonadales bacterium]
MRSESDDGLVGRLDRIGAERLARSAGLPAVLAARVAEVVVASGLPEDRRSEVFRELVAHFEDGLAAGRTPEELLASFGDGKRAGALIRREKRVVTPEPLGGDGPRDGWARQVLRDIRYAMRRLTARPAFTAIAVLSLALGIGANTAIFTLINDVILRKPPLVRPQELVDIYRSDATDDFSPLTYPDLEDLARRDDVFAQVAGYRLFYASGVDQGASERTTAQLVSGNYFSTLGVTAAHGRLIEAADAPAPGAGAVAVLGYRYWERVYGADPSIVGQTLQLSIGDYTIIGVVVPGFDGSFRGTVADLYIPLTRMGDVAPGMQEQFTNRSSRSVFARGRLQPGASVAQAQAAISAVAASNREQGVESWQGKGDFVAVPSADVIIFPPVDALLRPLMAMLMVVVGMVLIIACANLAGFLLARAIDRKKEIGIRLSLGATRTQLVRQLLVETVLLGAVGGVVGVLLGRAGLQALLAADLSLPIPVTLDLTLDWRVLGFTTVVSIAAGVLCGLVPALQATRLDLAGVIRDESAGGGRQKGIMRSALVMGQVVVSVVLLVVAGLFVRSLDALRNVDPGFGARPAALVWVMYGGNRAPEDVKRSVDRIRERLALLPGAESVGLTENVHLNLLNSETEQITVDGVDLPPGEVAFTVDRAGIDTGYIAAAGLRIVAGRNLAAFDLDSAARPVALVNEAFAARFWPDRDPIGRRYRTGDREVEVVGVVATAKIRNLAEPSRPFIYDATVENNFTNGWFVVSARGDADAMLAAAVRAVREADPNVLVMEQRTMARHIEVTALPIKLGASALAGFALLALLMAAIGLYGSVSYAVAQRSREVGIRLSLGADRRSVIRMLMWGGLRLVLLGTGLGMVLGFAFGRIMESSLYGVRALDPVTLLLVPAVLLGITTLAAYLPARRAGNVDPATALKQA